MNKLSRVLLLVSMAVSVSAYAQDAVSSLDFPVTEYDFGTRHEEEGIITKNYFFTNTGSRAVTITDVESYCGCTKARWPAQAIAPGAEGSVTLDFNPFDYKGDVQRMISVITDEGARIVLMIKGNIIPRVKPIPEACPVAFGNTGFRIERQELNLALTPAGTDKEMSIQYGNASTRRLRIKVSRTLSSGRLECSFPKSLKPGERGNLVFRYVPGDSAPCFLKDVFVVTVGDVSLPVTSMIAVTANEGSAQAGRERPSAYIPESYKNLGKLRSGESRTIRYTVRNNGNAPLELYDFRMTDMLSGSFDRGQVVMPGESFTFAITLDTAGCDRNSIFETFSILTNDPAYPVKDIMIAAKIVSVK